MVRRLSGEYPVSVVCRTLGVTRAGYYAYLGGKTHGGERQAEFDRRVRESFTQSGRAYGARRVGADLKKRHGVAAGRRRIRSSMRRQNLASVHEKKWKVRTTDSSGTVYVAPNLLRDGRCRPVRPGQVVAGDITFIPLRGGKFCYLAIFVDLFTRKVVGWKVGAEIRTELVMAALRMAVRSRRVRCEGVIHTDRGSQYGSHDYRAMLGLYGLRASMSRKGNCWDNAWAESFFSTLKTELTEYAPMTDLAEARAEIDRWIGQVYNRRRIHSELGGLSPDEFERRFHEQVKHEAALAAAA